MTSSVLNAGYYHIRSKHLKFSTDTELLYSPDKALLLELKAERELPADVLNSLKEQGRVASFSTTQNPSKSYVLFRQNPSIAGITIDSDAIESMAVLDFKPKTTELMTLQYGLKHYKDEVAGIAIMVDDFGLPSGLNKHLSLLLPESYQTLLQDYHIGETIMLSERIARNKVFKAIERKKPSPDSHSQLVTREQMDEAQMQCDTGSCATSSVFLVSNTIARETSGLKGCGGISGAIAINKPGRTEAGEASRDVPSCGVIIAGQIGQLASQDFTKIIHVHHKADDEELTRKLLDGTAIAAWLWPQRDMQVSSVEVTSSLESMEKRKQRSSDAEPFAIVQPYSFKLFNEGLDSRLLEEKYTKRIKQPFSSLVTAPDISR